MNSPISGPRSNKPKAASPLKVGPQGTLRVHGEDGGGQTCPASILMPCANTDLAAMLAGDGALCVRRPAVASSAQPAAPATRPPIADGDLARVIETWPSLAGETRAAIVALLDEPAAGRDSGGPP